MSLRSTGSDQIPAATLAVARAAFPKGSLAIRLRDALGVLFEDADFDLVSVDSTTAGPTSTPPE